MFEALTGTGLAASAGLNAYIPMLVVGLLGRYSDLITLPPGWRWLTNGWVVLILLALLAVEVVADKVPALDSVNDVVQTVVRPTSGGLVFGASWCRRPRRSPTRRRSSAVVSGCRSRWAW